MRSLSIPPFRSLGTVVALVLAACGPGEVEDRGEFEEPQPEPSVAREEAGLDSANVLYTAIFQPPGDAEEFMLRGSASVMAAGVDDNAFRIAIDLENLPVGDHTWDIRRSACDDLSGQIVVDGRAGGQPLRPDPNGLLQTILDVPADQLTLAEVNSGDYSLFIHATLQQSEESPIACAGLRR